MGMELRNRILQSIVTLLAVAAAARVVFQFLEPLLSSLIVLAALVGIVGLVIRRR